MKRRLTRTLVAVLEVIVFALLVWGAFALGRR